jgi:hypothetical protein
VNLEILSQCPAGGGAAVVCEGLALRVQDDMKVKFFESGRNSGLKVALLVLATDGLSNSHTFLTELVLSFLIRVLALLETTAWWIF